MKKDVVFLGDSITSGENNNFKSYAHYFAEQFSDLYNVTIRGVSGACFGNYSIYPVEDCLFTLIQNNIDILSSADILVIEFSMNDTASVSLGYVDLNKVYISINRAVDWIKQVSSAKIFFILPVSLYYSEYTNYLKQYVDYLNNEYLLCGLRCNLQTFCTSYEQIIQFITNNFNVFYMNDFLVCNLDVDNIHPNNNGYKEFSRELVKYLDEY